MKGSPVITCSYGNWLNISGSTNSLPQCVPSPCILPEIANGFYITIGYKAGLTISHGSSIDYSCRDGYVKRSESLALRCSESHLIPSDPVCISSYIITNGTSFSPRINNNFTQASFTGQNVPFSTATVTSTTATSTPLSLSSPPSGSPFINNENNLVLTIDASKINDTIYTSDDGLEEKILQSMVESDIELLNKLNSIERDKSTVVTWKSDDNFHHRTVKGSSDAGQLSTSSSFSSSPSSFFTSTTTQLPSSVTSDGSKNTWCSSPEKIEQALRFTGSYPFPAMVKEAKHSSNVLLMDDSTSSSSESVLSFHPVPLVKSLKSSSFASASASASAGASSSSSSSSSWLASSSSSLHLLSTPPSSLSSSLLYHSFWSSLPWSSTSSSSSSPSSSSFPLAITKASSILDLAQAKRSSNTSQLKQQFKSQVNQSNKLPIQQPHLHSQSITVQSLNMVKRSLEQPSHEDGKDAINLTSTEDVDEDETSDEDKVTSPSPSSLPHPLIHLQVTKPGVPNSHIREDETYSTESTYLDEQQVQMSPLEPLPLVDQPMNDDEGMKAPKYDTLYPIGSEFIFKCIPESPLGTAKKVSWKIFCHPEVGWIGQSFPCLLDEETIDLDLQSNATAVDDLKSQNDSEPCVYPSTGKSSGANLLAFSGDTLIQSPTQFTSGSTIHFRCVDIGKYELNGASELTCTDGKWTDDEPNCEGLSQEFDYALEKSPTILFRHSNGPIAQSTTGTLVVAPGTNLFLECLWIKKYGDPIWEVLTGKSESPSSNGTNVSPYSQGWTSEAGRDSGLEYRLSIFNATSTDSGVYTCVTPVKHRHSVKIEVKSVTCSVVPPEEIPKGIKVSYWTLDSSTGNRINLTINAPMVYTARIPMNGKMDLSCPDGMSINDTGAGKDFDITCLPSGNWSSKLPTCIVTQCPDITLVATGNTLTDGNSGRSVNIVTGGKSYTGFTLSDTLSDAVSTSASLYPSSQSTGYTGTGDSGNNTSRILPSIIMTGRTVGSRATFTCPRGFGLLGLEEVICTKTGHWSSQLPSCIELICPPPPVPENGYVMPEDLKETYHSGDLVTYGCLTGFVLRGSTMSICQESRQWSTRLPTCEVASF